MSKIQEKLAHAQVTFNEALIALEEARKVYEKGSGKAYAALLEHQENLRAKITSNEAAAEVATAEFKRLLAIANYEKTKAVKDVLFHGNDALAIAEELRAVLSESQKAALNLKLTASREARTYATVYGYAYTAYARLEIYRVLAECEEPLARAIALVCHVSVAHEHNLELTRGDLMTHRLDFLCTTLKEMALARPEAAQKPCIPELGTLDLGPFADRKFVSPVDVFKQRHALEAAAQA